MRLNLRKKVSNHMEEPVTALTSYQFTIVVLTRESGEDKLEEVDLHRKGKDHEKDATNLHSGIQGRSGETGPIESQAVSPNRP